MALNNIQLDVNQIFKRIYDDHTKSLQILPAHVGTKHLFSGAPASQDYTSHSINILAFKMTGIVVYWDGLDHTDGSIQFQASVDGHSSRYENLGPLVTLPSSSGHQSFSLIDEPYQYCRLVYNHGSNTVGTISASYIQRS